MLVDRVMLPLKALAMSGAKTTWKDTLLLGPSVTGKRGQMTVNSGRVLEIAEIAR
jgi:hypothetical protein